MDYGMAYAPLEAPPMRNYAPMMFSDRSRWASVG